MRGLLWNWRTVVGALVEALDWPETVVTGIGITALIMLILFLIGRWGIFRKFGEAGWKSLIPYYSQWVEYGYTWNPKIILWNVAAAIVNYIGDVSIIALKKGPILTVAMIAIIVFWICRFAVSAIAAHKLARAFAHGMGYTIGLLLLPGLFQFILGCGSSRYNGPEGRWSKEQE